MLHLQCLLGHPDSGHSGLLTSPDVNPINGCFFLYKCHLYCGFTTLTLADPKIWRKSAENDAEMAQNNNKKTKLVKFFYRLFPLVTNRYHPTDCFELAMLPAGKYSHGKL